MDPCRGRRSRPPDLAAFRDVDAYRRRKRRITEAPPLIEHVPMQQVPTVVVRRDPGDPEARLSTFVSYAT
jgi:hypothetical protein